MTANERSITQCKELPLQPIRSESTVKKCLTDSHGAWRQEGGMGRAPSVPVVSWSFPVDMPAIPGSGPARQAGSLRFPSVVRRSAPDAGIEIDAAHNLASPRIFSRSIRTKPPIAKAWVPPPLFQLSEGCCLFRLLPTIGARM